MRDDKRMPRSEQIEEAVLAQIRQDLRSSSRARARKPIIWTVGLLAATTAGVGAFFFAVNLSDSAPPCVDVAVNPSPTATPSPSETAVISGEVATHQRCQPRP